MNRDPGDVQGLVIEEDCPVKRPVTKGGSQQRDTVVRG